jgi:hypothetical protein
MSHRHRLGRAILVAGVLLILLLLPSIRSAVLATPSPATAARDR